MALFVVHDCAKVGVGVPNVDSGRIAAMDVDRWGSGGVAVLAEKCGRELRLAAVASQLEK